MRRNQTASSTGSAPGSNVAGSDGNGHGEQPSTAVTVSPVAAPPASANSASLNAFDAFDALASGR
jgi:hypothetical protein